MTRPQRSIDAECRFRARVAELGGTVLEPEWLGVSKRYRVRCEAGHVTDPMARLVNKGGGICRICAGVDQTTAWEAFKARVAELGGTVLEPEPLGANKPHRVRCGVGHVNYPWPAGVRDGGGICRKCAGLDPADSEAAFRARVAELGGECLFAEWRGVGKPHRVRCPAGHECSPIPSGVVTGGGLCRTCVGRDPASSWAKFRARVAELGGTVLEPEWLGSAKPHRVRCPAGHECSPIPSGVIAGGGICRKCAGLDPADSEAAFRARVAELGGECLFAEWRGVGKPHRVRCTAGHECSPRPLNVQQGQGICRTCAGQDTNVAREEFYTRVAELGGTVLEPEWLGSDKPHRVRCAVGHECAPRPHHVKSRRSLGCLICAGKDSATAWETFRARVTDQGGTVLEPEWLGSDKPHRVRCGVGHECAPRPSGLETRGICYACSGKDPATAWAAFRELVAELGGTVLEPEWLGSDKPHRVRCAVGHECAPRPGSVQQGGGICRICAGKDPATNLAKFRERVEALGGTVLETEWFGAITPHRVMCPHGHECSPTPHDVMGGGGICRRCKGYIWDVFYVVTDGLGSLKFGITSGDPGERLRRHRRNGYTQVVRCITGLAPDTAQRLELHVIYTLRDAREVPVRGREYYDISALALVLDIVDNYPGIAEPDAA